MRSTSPMKPRSRKGDRFQFELLEPRNLFSVSDGSAPIVDQMSVGSDIPLEHQVETLQASTVNSGVDAFADHAVSNYGILPIVDAGADTTIGISQHLQLDPNVLIIAESGLAVQWTKYSGPGTAIFSDATLKAATVQFDQPGTYLLKLTVTNFGNSVSDFVTVSVNGTSATDPIAPELFDTTYSLPTGGTTRYVNAGDNFQAVLNAAQLGDVIVLKAGVTFTGNFSLPKKEGAGWIYIISSQLDQLPVNERVSLEDAAHMPKLVAADNQLPVIRTEFGSNHYRLSGIEVSTGAAVNDLIRTGYGIPQGGSVWSMEPADTSEELPHHITFDRMLIHSTSDTNRLRDGIMLNGRYMAVLNSYIANVKDTADAQAIVTDNGDGPYKIVNNFLEATGENYMVGGSDPVISGSVPADIEFRGNYLFKRLEWKTSNLWGVKNLFELKNAQRVWVNGNVMENNWQDAQNGTAVLFTVRNQSGTAPWSVVQDINFENNIVKNVGRGFNITGEDDLQSSQQTKRIRINGNLLENVTRDYNDAPLFIDLGTVSHPILNLTITHNTFLSPPDEIGPSNHIAIDPGIMVDGFVLKDNIMVHGSYHPDWSRVTNANISNNALIMMPSNPRYTWNKDNFNAQHPGWLMANSGFGSVGFVDYQNGNYALAVNSPFIHAASDGTALGANMASLLQLTDSVTMSLGVDDTVVGSTELFSGAALFAALSTSTEVDLKQSEFELPPPTGRLDTAVDAAFSDSFVETTTKSSTPTLAIDKWTRRCERSKEQKADVDHLFTFLEQRQSGLRGSN